MLGLFRKILSRHEAPPVPPPMPAPPARMAPSPIRVTPAVPRPVQPLAPAAPVPVPVITPPAATSTHVQVALAAIAAGLPEAISHKVPANSGQFVAIPVEKILPQLASGTVSMTAAELRECSPESFAALAGHDDVEITLPLAEIVKQLSTGHFARREQTRTEVPSDVTPVFAPGSKGVSIAKTAGSQPATSVRPQPQRPTPAVAQPRPLATPAAAPTPIPMPAATMASAPAANPAPSVAPKISMSPQAMAAFNTKPATATAAVPSRPAASVATPKPTAAPQPLKATDRKAVVGSAKKPAPAAAKVTGELAVPLAWVCNDWVEEVRAQLADVETAQSEIHVPLDQLEPAMKSGRVVFSWQEVAGWIKPPLSIAPTPKVGEMAVELSLKTIIPLFMKQHRGGSQKRLAVDETIPDLFNGVNENGAAPALVAAPVPVVPPAPAPPAAPTRQPSVPLSPPARGVVPTTAAVSASPASTLRMAVSAKAAPMLAPEPKPAAAAAETAPAPENAPNEVVLEEIIGSPDQRFAAKEIVANATRLPGVDGALLALNDGLLVTSQTAPEVKAEMIAAFIPQMFGRMNQYTKELAMGPLRELTLSVEHGTWHVIKCNTIYFAVLGKRGESLPLNLLAQVATELSSQSN